MSQRDDLRMRTIVFVFDDVMHYHRETFRAIEAYVRARGDRFVLLTARRDRVVSGRTPLAEAVVSEQHTYTLHEWRVRGFSVRYQRGLLEKISSLRPCVVVTVCHSGTLTEWLVIARKRRLNFKLLAWQCGYEYNPGRIKDLVLSKFIPHFDHHLAYHSNAKHYAMRYGARADQVTVMHNTIDEANIACMPKDQARAMILEQFPQLAGKLIVLYVGAVLKEKRLEMVIRALDELSDARLAFLIVGDGPHVGRLREMTEKRSDVFFAGRVVSGVGQYFDAADIFVLPGTGGLALNEAMAHSLPVISGYADGSADDLIHDGVNGFRLKEGDWSELARRISELADEPEVRLSMGKASRTLITTRFSFASFISRATRVLDNASNR